MNLLNRQMASELAPLVLRLVLGLIFLIHGSAKFIHMSNAVAGFTRLGVPLPGFSAIVIGLLEVIGGIALILGLGLWTRILAFLLAIEMLVAIPLAKRHAGFVGGYEFELLLFAGLLAIVLGGQGLPALVRELRPAFPIQHEQAD
ncbi:MAG TPA: DoxX family protein [Ktedonobacteraceae bacterium]|nr:DoxX family protein [Ktedonobacteraceae bacterium]